MDCRDLIYVVERRGVYHQGNCYLTRDLDKALDVAKELKHIENTKGDGYHDYQVVSYKQDENYISELHEFNGCGTLIKTFNMKGPQYFSKR